MGIYWKDLDPRKQHILEESHPTGYSFQAVTMDEDGNITCKDFIYCHGHERSEAVRTLKIWISVSELAFAVNKCSICKKKIFAKNTLWRGVYGNIPICSDECHKSMLSECSDCGGVIYSTEKTCRVCKRNKNGTYSLETVGVAKQIRRSVRHGVWSEDVAGPSSGDHWFILENLGWSGSSPSSCPSPKLGFAIKLRSKDEQITGLSPQKSAAYYKDYIVHQVACYDQYILNQALADLECKSTSATYTHAKSHVINTSYPNARDYYNEQIRSYNRTQKYLTWANKWPGMWISTNGMVDDKIARVFRHALPPASKISDAIRAYADKW